MRLVTYKDRDRSIKPGVFLGEEIVDISDQVADVKRSFRWPPKITFEQAKGFSLFMLKAVLSGRGDEILDLARVNLIR